jgi:hypothetical protein
MEAAAPARQTGYQPTSVPRYWGAACSSQADAPPASWWVARWSSWSPWWLPGGCSRAACSLPRPGRPPATTAPTASLPPTTAPVVAVVATIQVGARAYPDRGRRGWRLGRRLGHREAGMHRPGQQPGRGPDPGRPAPGEPDRDRGGCPCRVGGGLRRCPGVAHRPGYQPVGRPDPGPGCRRTASRASGPRSGKSSSMWSGGGGLVRTIGTPSLEGLRDSVVRR